MVLRLAVPTLVGLLAISCSGNSADPPDTGPVGTGGGSVSSGGSRGSGGATANGGASGGGGSSGQ
jgi:hypothetical protein